MPQLDVSTFSSQIFWVLVGFLLVYIFMSTVVTPALKGTLDNRASHVDAILKNVEKLRTEAEKLEDEAEYSLENARKKIRIEEDKLESTLRQKSEKEKEKLHSAFIQSSQQASDELVDNARDVLSEMSANLDDIVADAEKKISLEKNS